MKSYTDLEQSKILSKILPLESADMWYWEFPTAPTYNNYGYPMFHKGEDIRNVPCWSLAVLLDVLPTIDDRNVVFCKDIRCDKWHVFYHGTATLPLIDTERYHDVIDACVDMIEKLHRLKML